MHLIGYKIRLVRKRNAHGEVVRHKARLVAKGCTRIWGQDYNLTDSPVIESITYSYLIAFYLIYKLKLHLMDVVTTYLYGILDTEIHMHAAPELIKRVKFHIEGEKTLPLSTNIKFGIYQIVPTSIQLKLIDGGSTLSNNKNQNGPLSHITHSTCSCKTSSAQCYTSAQRCQQKEIT